MSSFYNSRFLTSIFIVFFAAISSFATSDPDPTQLIKELNKISFIENKGQVVDDDGLIRPDILYTASDGNIKFFLNSGGISYSWLSKEYLWEGPLSEKEKTNRLEDLQLRPKSQVQTYRIDMELVGANPNARIVAAEQNSDMIHFYRAEFPDGITNVRHFNKVTYENIYDNIDMVLYIIDNKVKYDFVVNPGGNVDDIKIQYHGNTGMDVTANGSLEVQTPLGSLREVTPYTFQQNKRGRNDEVISKFHIKDGYFTFDIGKYNRKSTLVIDPEIVWSTYYGDSEVEIGYDVKVDDFGNIFLEGWTDSSTGISSSGHQNTIGGGNDAYLVKFNSAGVRQWATYYGGSDEETARGIDTDASGNVYLVGNTASTTGIATTGAHQETYGGGALDGYLVKFNSAGVRQWGTYYGGSGTDELMGVTVDPAGPIYVGGRTSSTSSIATAGSIQTTFGGGTFDGMVVRFASTGARDWGTYYGGSGTSGDHIFKIDLDNAATSLYIAGLTNSTSGIASGVGVHQLTYGGGDFDGFLAHITDLATGTLDWGSYYGGTLEDAVLGMVVDFNDDIYISGHTKGSTTGIASTGAHQVTYGGGSDDAFMAKFDSLGRRFWGTYIGGTGKDKGRSISTFSNFAFMIGLTNSTNGIANLVGETPPQPTNAGSDDAFVVKFNKNGLRKWGTYHGGDRRDLGYGIDINAGGDIVFCGKAGRNLPLIGTGFSQDYIGQNDAFVARMIEPSIDEPEVQATNVIISNITSTSMKIQWTSGNGDSRLVVAKAATAVDVDPVDNNTYVADANFGDGDDLGTSNFAVYSSTGNFFTMTGLTPGVTYHVAVYEFNGFIPGLEDYLVTSPATGSATTESEPTDQATNVIITGVTENSMTINWTNGSGTARIVIAKQVGPVNRKPVDNTTYAANSNYPLGELLGSRNRVVYDGTGNSFTMTGLLPNRRYDVAVHEYSGGPGSQDYLQDNPATGFAITLTSGGSIAGPLGFSVSAKNDNLHLTFDDMDVARGVIEVYDFLGNRISVVDNTVNTKLSHDIAVRANTGYVIKVNTRYGSIARKVLSTR